MKKLALVMITILGLSSAAQADLWLEPFLGYAITAETDSSTDVTGMDYGLRGGMTMSVFSLGLEYAKGSYKAKGSSAQDTDDLGLTIAYDFPVMVRAYATYFVKSTWGKNAKGTGGYRVGFGYTGFPFLDINLETFKRDYDEDGSVDGFQVGLSVPLP